MENERMTEMENKGTKDWEDRWNEAEARENAEREKTGISSPWVSYVHKATALFGEDPDIAMSYDDETKTLKMLVKGNDKAEALTRLLPPEINFSGTKLFIDIHPENQGVGVPELIRNALIGNPHFSEYIRVQPSGCGNAFHYMMFHPEVAQYWDDNLGHPHGIVTRLYQDLAEELLGSEGGVFYCTEQE